MNQYLGDWGEIKRKIKEALLVRKFRPSVSTFAEMKDVLLHILEAVMQRKCVLPNMHKFIKELIIIMQTSHPQP